MASEISETKASDRFIPFPNYSFFKGAGIILYYEANDKKFLLSGIEHTFMHSDNRYNNPDKNLLIKERMDAIGDSLFPDEEVDIIRRIERIPDGVSVEEAKAKYINRAVILSDVYEKNVKFAHFCEPKDKKYYTVKFMVPNNKLGIPKGGVSDCDEDDPNITAIREFREETGIDFNDKIIRDNVDQIKVFYHQTRNYYYFFYKIKAESFSNIEFKSYLEDKLKMTNESKDSESYDLRFRENFTPNVDDNPDMNLASKIAFSFITGQNIEEIFNNSRSTYDLGRGRGRGRRSERDSERGSGRGSGSGRYKIKYIH